MKGKTQKQRKHIRIARGVLHTELFFLVLCGILLLLEYLSVRSQDPVLADSMYPAMAEYLVAGIVIAVGTFVCADLLEQEAYQREE